MNSTVTGLVWGLLVVAFIEGVQAAATRHLRRLGACALGGVAVAVGVAAFELAKRHKQLAASAASAHESLTHLVTLGMVALAVTITVVAYVIATFRARTGGGGMRLLRRSRRMTAGPPPGSGFLPPGSGF